MEMGRIWAELSHCSPGLPDHTCAALGACKQEDNRESKSKSGCEYQAREEAELSFHVTHLFQRKGCRPHGQGQSTWANLSYLASHC